MQDDLDFNYSNERNKLKSLRYKIYSKQKIVIELIFQNKIDYSHPKIKNLAAEIFILEEVFDCKKSLFQEYSKEYWKN